MTEKDKQIQDLHIEIDKLRKELEESKKALEESKMYFDNHRLDCLVYFANQVREFVEHPEKFSGKETR